MVGHNFVVYHKIILWYTTKLYHGAAGIQPIVRLLSSGRGGSGGGGRSGWWVVGARVWELVKVRVEWKLFAMTWRLLVRCCEL